MSSNRPNLVIAASEDTIVINDSIDLIPTYFLQCEFESIYIITPKLESHDLVVADTKGPILEMYYHEFLKKVVPGSLVIPSCSLSARTLYKDLYESGALNRSIKRVMKVFNVNNYELPIPQGSLYTKVTHEREDYFSIPGQE